MTSMNRLFLLIISIFALFLTACINQTYLQRDLKNVPQSNLFFAQQVPPAKRINSNPELEKELVQHYRKLYFMPWQNPFHWDQASAIEKEEAHIINAYTKDPGWATEKNLHSISWAKKIKKNMQLTTYPNTNRHAISVNASNLRLLPTLEAVYGNPQNPSEGYPFDKLQTTFVSANTPLYVLQTTHDGAWQLVITPYHCFGWLKSADIAYVDANFMRTWIQSQYVTAVRDIKLTSDQQPYASSIQIGELFPWKEMQSNSYQLLTAARQNDGTATMHNTSLTQDQVRPWPIPLNTVNIAKIADQFIGTPYAWGGLNGHRDCSKMTQDIFAPFALWLPRNSEAQLYTGKVIALGDLSNREKEKVIKQKGIPFLTLLWVPGHILLYIGEKNGEVLVFHNPWALHTKKYWRKYGGRVVIGHATITTLDVGKRYINVLTYIDALEGMNVMASN
jgi:cell wall-associated NlpC family hydrolase